VPQTNQIRSFSGKFVIQLAKVPDPSQLLLGSSTVYLNGKCESIINLPKLWTHVVQAYSRNEFDSLDALLNTQKSPKIWLRYGVTDGSNSFFTEWEPQVLVSVRTQPSSTPSVAHGFAVTIVTADLLYTMAKNERVSSRKGKVADIVTSIALENGFEKTAIEPTQGDYALIQSFESDLDFIRDRLLSMASNKDGASQFLLYAKGSFLHFHTPNYQVGGVYAFDYGSPSNTLTSVSLTNKVNTNEHTKASGVKLVAFDPLTGKTTVWETRPDLELSLANTLPQVEGAVYARKHVGQNQLTALYNESQSSYVDVKDEMHEVSFLVDNYPFIGVGDMISAQFVNATGDPWSGFYYVRFARHEVKNAQVTSFYSLMRGEFVSDEPNVTGKQLNPSELASSPLTSETSGNFPSLAGGSVVDVNSPASLLIPPPSS
jgi:hypothetical protein